MGVPVQILGIASRLVRTVAEHKAMCYNFVANLVAAHPEIRAGSTRIALIVENDNGPWPVDGFVTHIRDAVGHMAPEVRLFAAYKTRRERNEETRQMVSLSADGSASPTGLLTSTFGTGPPPTF